VLNATEELAFVTATEDWVDQLHNWSLSLPQVVVNNQSLVSQTRRMLKGTQQLAIKFELSVVYSGSDMSFNLSKALTPLLQTSPDASWIHMLGNYNNVFLQLRPSNAAGIEGAHTTSKGEMAISHGGLAAILVVALAAVGLAVGASIYSMRSHKLATYGEELESPVRNSVGVSPSSRPEAEPRVHELQTYSTKDENETNMLESVMNGSFCSVGKGETSVFTNCMTDTVLDDLERTQRKVSNESHSSRDPPVAAESEISYNDYRNKGPLLDNKVRACICICRIVLLFGILCDTY
jgi:hypothetical protein